MNQSSTTKEANVSSKGSALRINQSVITFDIQLSKNPSNTTNSSSKPPNSSSKPPNSVTIDIERQQPATCPICLGDYPLDELRSCLKCKHSFCQTCLTEYLNVKVNNNEVLDILCPQSGCQELFTKKSVKGILTREQYKRYQDLVIKKMDLKSRKKAYCPQPGCSRPVKLAKEEEFSQCECGAKICNACHNPFHEGKTCIEAIDSDFENYARENGVKFCMMCKTVVLKETGCNHMKCAVCDYEWCWVCGRDDKDSRHYCPGEWSPIPPASIRKDGLMWKLRNSWKEGSVLKRIGICLGLFLLSPLLLIGFLIFYPTYFQIGSSLGFQRRKPIKSVCIILGATFLGLILLPNTIMTLIVWAILLALYAVLLFPIIYLVKYLIRKFGKERPKPQLQTRWHSRNPENFTYRPTNTY